MFLNFGEHMAPLSPRLLRLRPPPPLCTSSFVSAMTTDGDYDHGDDDDDCQMLS